MALGVALITVLVRARHVAAISSGNVAAAESTGNVAIAEV